MLDSDHGTCTELQNGLTEGGSDPVKLTVKTKRGPILNHMAGLDSDVPTNDTFNLKPRGGVDPCKATVKR